MINYEQIYKRIKPGTLFSYEAMYEVRSIGIVKEVTEHASDYVECNIEWLIPQDKYVSVGFIFSKGLSKNSGVKHLEILSL